MAEAPIGIGVIGCGWVAEHCHLPALRVLRSARVVALADVDLARAGRLAERFAVPQACGSMDELLATSGLDAVAICVPPLHHVDLAIAALNAQKHVLVEKPLAVSLDDADRLAACVAGSDRKAMMGFPLRWHHLVQRAHADLRTGDGLRAVSTLHTTYSGAADHLTSGWRGDRATGGGVLHDRGSHHFDLWRYLLGAEIEEIFATIPPGCDLEHSAIVNARLSTGALAAAIFTEDGAPANDFEIHAMGRRIRVATYRFDGFQVSYANERGELRTRGRVLGAALAALPRGIRDLRHGGASRSSFIREWEHFLRAIQRDTPVASTIEDGRRALAVSLAAIESATSGRAVRVANIAHDGTGPRV